LQFVGLKQLRIGGGGGEGGVSKSSLFCEFATQVNVHQSNPGLSPQRKHANICA
jgi:hypothetical protein